MNTVYKISQLASSCKSDVEIEVQKTIVILSVQTCYMCSYNCVVIMCTPSNLVSEVGLKTHIKDRMTSEDEWYNLSG